MTAPIMKQSFYARHNLTILAVVVFLLPLAVVGAMKAKTHNRNDVRGWLPMQYEETRLYRDFRSQFKGEEFILVSWEGCTLSDQRLNLMAKKLVPPTSTEPNADDPPALFKTVLTGPSVLDRMTAEPLDLEREDAINRLTGSLVGPPRTPNEPIEQRQSCLVVTLTDEARKNLHAAIKRVIDVAEDECAIRPADLHLGGPPVDNVAIDDAGQNSLMVLLGLSFLVGSICSWFSLKSGRLVTLVVVTGIYSMVLSLAVVWYTGSPVDAIVLTMPSLVYVATTSGAIHLSNYYRDAVAESGTRVGAATAALKHAALPLGLATGTTAVGLLTLCYSDLIPIQLFGIYSAVGVIVSLLLLVFLIPAALECWPPKLHIGALATTEEEAKKWRPPEETRAWRLGEWILDRHRWIAAACLIVMGLTAWGMSKAETSVQLMRLFSSRARILEDYRWLEQRLGPLVPMEVVLHVDRSVHDDLEAGQRDAMPREVGPPREIAMIGGVAGAAAKVAESIPVRRLTLLDRMELVSRIRQRIESIDEVGSSLSTLTFVPDVGGGSGDGKVLSVNGRTRRSVVNKRLLAHRSELLEGDYLREWQDPATGKTEELWRISARVSALKNVDYAQFTGQLREIVQPLLDEQAAKGVTGLKVVYTGLIPLVYKAQHSLMDGLVFGFLTDFALIVAVMMIACRDWSVGIVLLIPSAFPAVAVFGIIGWLHTWLTSAGIGNLYIDIGIVMAPSVALGVTVDDVVHFMLWFQRGIQQGMTRKQAVMLAYRGCARAMYQSWGVIGVGLAVFAFSPFGPTQRFGMMMLSMLTIALVANLLLLPTLLAGPLGALFAWGILRKQRRLEAKLKAQGKELPSHHGHVSHGPAQSPVPAPHIAPKSPVPTPLTHVLKSVAGSTPRPQVGPSKVGKDVVKKHNAA